MVKIKISVIIPTFNRASLLPRAIRSVIAQTQNSNLYDLELLIIDDGSTDNTTQVVKQFLNPQMRYIIQNHCGVSTARNKGIEQAHGDIICFLDSDDEWLPNKLSQQLFELTQSSLIWNQTLETWIRNGHFVNPPKTAIKQQGSIFDISLQRCMVTPSSVMIYKKVLEQENGFDETLPTCEDYDLWLRLTCKYPIGLVKKKLLIRYGGHSDQLSSKYPTIHKYQILAITKLLKQNILNSNQYSLAIKALNLKLKTYQQGCEKRNRQEEVKWCQQILQEFLTSFH